MLTPTLEHHSLYYDCLQFSLKLQFLIFFAKISVVSKNKNSFKKLQKRKDSIQQQLYTATQSQPYQYKATSIQPIKFSITKVSSPTQQLYELHKFSLYFFRQLRQYLKSNKKSISFYSRNSPKTQLRPQTHSVKNILFQNLSPLVK